MSTLTEDAPHRRLLIVDCDRRSFDGLRDFFTEKGFECEVALSVTTGMAILLGRHMDVVVANAEAADGDEAKFIEGFKAANPNMALVIYNGTRKKAVQRRLRRLGAASYLSKSSDLRAVIRAIERAIAAQ